MAQTDAAVEDRPKPMGYTSLSVFSCGTSTADEKILTPADVDGMSFQDAIEKAFADYLSGYRTDPSNPDPAPGAKFFHSEWMSVEEAAEAVEHYPEMGKYGFYPPSVAIEVRSLPSDALVALGREQHRPVLYVFTNRPPMAATLKGAGQCEVMVEVADQYPDESGESALEYDGRPGGEWHTVRVGWYR